MTANRIPPGEEPYLVSPLTGYPLTSEPQFEPQLVALFRDLPNRELDAVAAAAQQLNTAAPAFHPVQVLLAQVAFLRRQDREAILLLNPVADELPSYVACQLLLGRAAERLGELPEAYVAFRAIRELNALAAVRHRELEPRAVEILGHRLEDAIARKDGADAERQLAKLSAWLAPQDRRLLEGQRQWAAFRQDLPAELAALRQLVELVPENREWGERRGDLELEIGDVRAGLEQFTALAARYPGDSGLTTRVERAKFLWRLQQLPPKVQALGKRAQLNRAEVATLLYWLIPEVRYAKVSNPPIATDILDHPQREEIVRVVNLGLIDVDLTLHRFNPGAPASRSLLLRALLRLLTRFGHGFACLEGAQEIGVATSARAICDQAAQCSLIPAAADCLPEAAASGAEAIDIFRRTLDLLEAIG